MPDVNALYPQPPQPSQGLLSGDPSKVIDIARGVNALSLFPLQKDMLQTQVTGGHISNVTAQQQQNAQRQAIIANSYSAIDPKTATADTIHSHAAFMRRQGFSSAEVLAARDHVLNDPQGIAHGVASMRNLGIGAAGVTAPGPEVISPTSPTGAKEIPTMGEFGMRAAAGTGAAPSSLPPGAAIAREATGKTSGEQLAEARVIEGNYRRQVTPLEKAIPALERLGPTGTGIGSETIQNIRSFAQTMGLPVGWKTSDDIKDYDTARKYLQDWVMQNGNTQSVQHLLSSTTSNPSVHISNASAVDLAKTALALRRMQRHQVMEFGRSGQQPEEYSKWALGWNGRQNPDLYRLDMMNPKQRNDFIKAHPSIWPQVRQMEKDGIFSAPGSK